MLLRQPVEIIDTIASWIDGPDDLTAMALASRTLARIVHPWHTQFRVIQCSATNALVWGTLTANPGLARNIRVLEVHPSDLRVPCMPCEENSSASARGDIKDALVSALKEMWFLTSFSWYTEDARLVDENICAALADCKNLKSLNIHEPTTESPLFMRSPTIATRLWNLTTFKYCSQIRPPLVDLSAMGTMLRERCPHLQHLCIALPMSKHPPHFNLDPHILKGRWRSLRSVSFTCAAASPESVISFFRAHPDLTEVETNVLFISDPHGKPLPLKCPRGMLPNLRRLTCHMERAVEILTSLTETPRPLQLLDVTSSPILVVEQVLDLLQRLRSLHTLRLYMPTAELVHGLARVVPWLREMTCSWVPFTDQNESGKVQWRNAIDGFDDLRSFHAGWSGSSDVGLIDLLAIIYDPTPLPM